MSAISPEADINQTIAMSAMCQSRHFALQEKQRPFSASDHHQVGDSLPNGDLQHCAK
jgi:hypothetical protein